MPAEFLREHKFYRHKEHEPNSSFEIISITFFDKKVLDEATLRQIYYSQYHHDAFQSLRLKLLFVFLSLTQ